MHEFEFKGLDGGNLLGFLARSCIARSDHCECRRGCADEMGEEWRMGAGYPSFAYRRARGID